MDTSLIRQKYLHTLDVWFGLAECSSSKEDISEWPSWELKCNGVNPALDSASALAPYSNNVVAISICDENKNLTIAQKNVQKM